jgi:hypothetical protein
MLFAQSCQLKMQDRSPLAFGFVLCVSISMLRRSFFHYQMQTGRSQLKRPMLAIKVNTFWKPATISLLRFGKQVGVAAVPLCPGPINLPVNEHHRFPL